MSVIDFTTVERDSAEWWLRRLLYALDARRSTLALLNDYYEGKHPLSFFDDTIREKFSGRFRRFASNFTALVVDGFAERFEVQGFRFNDSQGDRDLWAIWQDNDLDGQSQEAHIEALVKGSCNVLVEPNGGRPRITIEDAFDSIVESDPRDSRRRLAGLKRFVNDQGYMIAYVYLPDGVYTYRSAAKWDVPAGFPAMSMLLSSTPASESAINAFERIIAPGETDWPIKNPLGVVPLVPIENRRRLRGGGRSEITAIMSNQDLINYYRAMAVVGARYMALPQRWVKNLETATDAETGQSVAPFKSGLADLWTVPPFDPDDPRADKSASQVEFGQFAAADLTPYARMIESEVGAMSSITRMPYHYLLGQPMSVPPSGESLHASEAALVRKVRSGSIFLGEGWEETMRVALRAMRDERADLRTAATIWADPETQNLAVLTDAITKQLSAGIIDLDTAAEVLGYSPEQRVRIAAALDAQRATAPPAPTDTGDDISQATGIALARAGV